ncbi:signal transduction histidine kinase [Azospirillum agricola]|nr:signal transduction histidine kinase [Azospirillum agricola]
MRDLDWSRTPVGPVDGWPQSLRATVRTLLASRYPMILTWGPHFTQFYNDAYAELIGDKHPEALGIDIRVTLDKAWDTLGPMIDEVMRTGVANWTPALLLLLERAGYPEEAYFSVSHAPAEDDDGRIVGMLAVCSEVTPQVVGERRIGLLRDLAAKAGEARSVEAVCRDSMAIVAQHPLDLPFLLLYLANPEGTELLLHGAVGMSAAELGIPERLSLDGGGPDPWGLRGAAAGGTVVTGAVDQRVAKPAGPWGDPVRVAVSQPIGRSGHGAPIGVLIAGTSPNRALDEGYRSFLDLLAGQMAVLLGNALAYEAERRRADALAELDHAKTLFFSNVSHEFRTPLTLLLGPLEELLPKAAAWDAADGERLRTIHRNGLRLLKLVNALLDFARIEAGRTLIRFEATDLAAFTADIAGSFRSAVETAGLRFEVACGPLSRTVAIDRDMWEKIVLNLLSNALKHTLAGGIAVRLTESPEGVALAVSDTGSGIAAEDRERIFDRFHRIASARARTHEGTGIGLALVRELARLHGGDVTLASAVDAGSTFTVSLPWEPDAGRAAEDGQAADLAPTPLRADAFLAEAGRWGKRREDVGPSAPSAPARAAGDGTPARVLIVDDNADMRDYVARLLAPDFAVATAEDGAEALEAVRADKPDLVLSDVMMPRLDGFGLLAALRSDPATRDVPVVLLSARAGEEASVEGLDAGADDYLVKPFSSRELIARVRANLTMARLRREAADAHHDAERMRALGQLTSGVAHDFNNLLMVLRGAVHLVGRRTSEPAIRVVLDQATEAIERGALMTRQLLSFARRQRLEPQPLDINERLSELAAVLGRAFPENIRVELSLGDVPAILVDRAELEAALLNLAVNARDAMPQGGTLRFETGRSTGALIGGEPAPDGLVGIRVIDSGTGMAPDVARRAFEPFFTTKPPGKGTGLGLSQVHGFATQSGGRATVASRPGNGTTITLHLPAAE